MTLNPITDDLIDDTEFEREEPHPRFSVLPYALADDAPPDVDAGGPQIEAAMI